MEPNDSNSNGEEEMSPRNKKVQNREREPTSHTLRKGTIEPNNSNSNEEEVTSPMKERVQRRKRGPTSLTLRKGKKKKHTLQFNLKGQPKGKSRKLTSTEAGKICRSYAPINCRTWKHVPLTVKEKILEVIEKNYDCNTSKNWKKKVMTKVGNRFRGFKNFMYGKFILPNLNNLENIVNPPAGYTSITPEQWTDFVAQRTAKSWARVRKKAQESRSKNVYPHHMGRKGYAGLEEELQHKNNTTESIDRHVLWKEGRQKDGKFVEELTREAAAKIDELSRKVDDGSLTIEGANDVLTQALGTKEYSGHVRGVGALVTPSLFFETPHPANPTFHQAIKEANEWKKYMATVASELQRIGVHIPLPPMTYSAGAEYMDSCPTRESVVRLDSPQVDERLHQESQSLPQPSKVSKKRKKSVGSYQSKVIEKSNQCTVESANPSPTSHTQQKINLEKEKSMQPLSQTDPDPPGPPTLKNSSRPCRLALGTIDRVVAHGYVEKGNVIHCTPVAEGFIRVSIYKLHDAKYGKELLPVPTIDARTVGEAVGSFVVWPQHLVITKEIALPKEKPKEKPRTKIADINVVLESFGHLVDLATGGNNDVAIDVVVDSNVFRFDEPFRLLVDQITVLRSDLFELISFKEIGASIMKLYMCVLHDKAKQLGVEATLRFVEPAGLTGFKGSENKQHLFQTLESGDMFNEQMFFYPYNIGHHWVLAIIVPTKRQMYYFDPLGNEVDANVAEIFTYVCKQLDYSFKFKTSKKKTSYEKVMCPIQPGSVECGYYVMRYMKDVIASNGTNPATLFDNDDHYESILIDEVRIELMNFIRDKIAYTDAS